MRTRRRVPTCRADRGGVFWIEQMLPRPEVVQLLSHATVFVCPSVYEPFGLINVEAMACEVPVVASATGGIPEIVVDGETGYLVPFEASGDAFGSPRDPARFAQDLAARINELLAGPRQGPPVRPGRTRPRPRRVQLVPDRPGHHPALPATFGRLSRRLLSRRLLSRLSIPTLHPDSTLPSSETQMVPLACQRWSASRRVSP